MMIQQYLFANKSRHPCIAIDVCPIGTAPVHVQLHHAMLTANAAVIVRLCTIDGIRLTPIAWLFTIVPRPSARLESIRHWIPVIHRAVINPLGGDDWSGDSAIAGQEFPIQQHANVEGTRIRC